MAHSLGRPGYRPAQRRSVPEGTCGKAPESVEPDWKNVE